MKTFGEHYNSPKYEIQNYPIMELQQVKEMTNDYGKKFLDFWFKEKEILGVERGGNNNCRKEFTIVYVSENLDWHTGKVTSTEICTAVLPDKDSKNDGCCFFGDLQHFSMVYAEEKSGVRLRMNPQNCKLMWPVWYTEEKDFLRWKSYYDEMMKKYS